MKSVKGTLSSVIALTLCLGSATALAQQAPDIISSVNADADVPGPVPANEELDVDELVASDKAASAGLPLNLRKNEPLALAEEKPTTGWTWKIILSAGIVGGAAWLLRRRFKPTAAEKTPVLDVVCRKSVGVRSEICVVTVDGHRLLLGITPNNIQRLAALPDPDDLMTIAEVEAPESEPAVENGFGGVLQNTYAKIAQLAEDQRISRGKTMSASEVVEVPPPASSKPRVIVRESQAAALEALIRRAS